MSTIKRFEDLECWQEARKLVKLIYSAIKANPEFQKDCDSAFQVNSFFPGSKIFLNV